MTSSGILLNQDFFCVFCALHWQKMWFLEGLQKLWLIWWRTSWIKALRDVQTTHLCGRKHPWCSRPKEFLWRNVTPPNTEPECIYVALGLSHCSVSFVVCSIIGCWVAAPATNLILEVRSLHLFTHHPCPSEMSLSLSHNTRRVTSSIIWK